MPPVHFLLVDDLSENLLSLEALLRRDGLSLLKASSGDEALELLLEYDVALAIVDVRMPGLDGFQLAELMRGKERTRRIPIIFVTAGNSDVQRRFRGYEAGAVDFIFKPIEADILRSKADVFFDLYRQRQQIAEQRDTLGAQAEALKEADRRKDEFLATLAHELRNPLAPILHGLETLQRNPDRTTASEIRSMMERQTFHLVRLIDDLLDASRISQGKLTLRKENILVSDAVLLAIETVRPMIEAAGHKLVLEIPSEPIWIRADAVRFAQIVSNLLSNSVKYTPEGGTMTVAAGTKDQNAWVSVSDNGIGIPKEMLSKIFQLFTQVDQHVTRARGGLGIGLALVKQLIELHGGDVSVESSGVGQGSIFKIQIPLEQRDNSQREAETIHPMPILESKRKVLVIDDTVEVAATIGWMLEDMGHEFRIIHDGREALGVARDFQPDVILLDIGLPHVDGYAVCRSLRGEESLSTVKIIAQTGWGQEKDKIAAEEAGFDLHLVKPVPYATLERIIAELHAKGS